MTSILLTTEELSSRAVLSQVRISMWGTTRKDKGATDTVAREYQAARDAGNYVKKLLPDTAMQAVRKAAQRVRLAHAATSLAWDQEGMRLVPLPMLQRHKEQVTEAIGEFEQAVRELLDRYDEYVAEAQLRLGGLYNPSEYPSRDEVAGKFKAELNLFPVTTTENVKFFDETIREEVEKNVRRLMDESLGAAADELVGYGLYIDLLGPLAAGPCSQPRCSGAYRTARQGGGGA